MCTKPHIFPKPLQIFIFLAAFLPAQSEMSFNFKVQNKDPQITYSIIKEEKLVIFSPVLFYHLVNKCNHDS